MTKICSLTFSTAVWGVKVTTITVRHGQLANKTGMMLSCWTQAEVGGRKWQTDLQRGASRADTLEGSVLPVHSVFHLLSLLSCLRSPPFNLLLHLPLLILRKTDALRVEGSSADFFFFFISMELSVNLIWADVGGALLFASSALLRILLLMLNCPLLLYLL